MVRYATLLLFLTLPYVLAQMPADSLLLTIYCGGDVNVYYRSLNGNIVFFYSEGNKEVVRAFLSYYNLVSNYDRLAFLRDDTITSIKSLASSLEQYRLRLEQAKRIISKQRLDIDISGLISLSKTLEISLQRESNLSEQLLSDIREFLKRPRCGFEPDLSPLSNMEDIYVLADELLKRYSEISLSLADKNISPQTIAVLSDLLKPPYSRSYLDELLARARADLSMLEEYLEPDNETVARLLYLSNKYRTYTKLQNFLHEEIRVGTFRFPNLEDAITYILNQRDLWKEKGRVQEMEEAYENFKKLVSEGKYDVALEVARRLRRYVEAILSGGFAEEDKKNNKNLPVALLIALLIVLGVFIYWRRRRESENEEVMGIDSDIDDWYS